VKRILLPLALCALPACREKPPAAAKEAVTIVGLAELEQRIASHGRPLLVNFWAVW